MGETMIQNTPVKLELTPGEKNSSAWQKIKSHLEERVAIERINNDKFTQSELETMKSRALINVYNKLLELDQ